MRVMCIEVIRAHPCALVGLAVLAHRQHIILGVDRIASHAPRLRVEVQLLGPIVVASEFIRAEAIIVQLSSHWRWDGLVIG